MQETIDDLVFDVVARIGEYFQAQAQALIADDVGWNDEPIFYESMNTTDDSQQRDPGSLAILETVRFIADRKLGEKVQRPGESLDLV